MKVEFKVAMDAEEAKAKNHHEVSLEVDMTGASREELEKYALKAYKVELQSQIRPNWGEFIKGAYPRELKFGEALFASTKGKISEGAAVAKTKSLLDGLSLEEKMAKLKELGLL